MGLTILALIIGYQGWLAPYIKTESLQSKMTNGKVSSKDLLTELNQASISSSQKWKIIQKHVLNKLSYDQNYNVFVGPNSSYVNGENQTEPFDTANTIKLLKEYVEQAPLNGFLVTAAKELSTIYARNNKMDQAHQVLQQAEKRLNNKEKLNEVTQLLEEEIKLYILQQQFDKAQTLLKNPHLYDDNSQTLVQLKKRLQTETAPKNPALSIVQGVIKRSNGTPMSDVGVYLRTEGDVNHSILKNEPFQTTTDQNGHYQFKNVPPGSYQLYLGFYFKQISGWTWPVMLDDWITIKHSQSITKNVLLRPLIECQTPVNQQTINSNQVHFKWNKVKGAAYYKIDLGLKLKNGSAYNQLLSHIKTNHAEVPIQTIYDHEVGFSYDNKKKGWLSVNPLTLLAFYNTNQTFLWYVEAYDKHGNLLSKSNGYRVSPSSIGNLPFFSLKARTMTEADHEVLSKHYQKAIDLYKKNLSDHPRNVHDLNMLVRLMWAKAIITGKQTDDLQLPYLKQLVSIHPTVSNTSQLMGVYYKKEEWHLFNEVYKTYLTVASYPEESTYNQSIVATALMKQGEYAQSEKIFHQTMEQDKSHRFVGYYLAVHLYRTHDLASTYTLAKSFPQHFYGNSPTDWASLVKGLMEEKAQKKVTQQQINNALKQLMTHTKKEDKWVKTIKNPKLQQFIKAVLNVG